MSLNPNLLTAAISALVGCPVITYEEYCRNPSQDIQPLDMDAFHKTILVAVPPEEPPRSAPQQPGPTQPGPTQPALPPQQPGPTQQSQPPVTTLSLISTPVYIFVKTLTGSSIAISISLDDTVQSLKLKIAENPRVELPADEQRLIYGGRQLEDSFTLRDYGIHQESTIHLALRIRGGGPVAMYLPQNFCDPGYDYDFTYIKDPPNAFYRGGEVYTRPCGWLRYALKVSGKYGSDTWLGSSNAPGEWPVSYHGTPITNVASIASTGLRPSAGGTFGAGVYSSPDLRKAKQYARGFPFQGKIYQVIFQNRVNPSYVTKHNAVEWTVPGEPYIRPYGICIKEV